MAPKVTQATVLNPIELRLSGGLLALNRLIMTFQNKRMPVAGLTVGRDGEGMRATIVLDCPPETARRYAALLKPNGEGWRESAAQLGITAHEEGGTIVASGDPESMEAWLGSLEVEDIVRLGPVARPGDGG